MEVRNVSEAAAFITKDGSEIRELLAHRNSSIKNQSLAEARVFAGCRTQEHYHAQTEEIYFILAGQGQMRVNDEERKVGPGDAIAILPGQRHHISNTGSEPLRLLCCCAPGYEHEDTILTGSSTTEANIAKKP